MTAISASLPTIRQPDTRFYKFVVWANCAVPGALLAYDASRGHLGANPVNFAIRTTGLLSLLFLVLSLAVTPARRVTGWTWLIAHRRALGLFAFFYGVFHFLIFFFKDREGSISSTVSELLARKYLIFGSISLLLMLPLALTSGGAAVRALGGKNWKRLHRLAYVAAAAGALHYFLLVKADVRQPLAFAGVLAVLLLARAVWALMDRRRRNASAAAGAVVGSGADGASVALAVPGNVGAGPRFWRGELTVLETRDETPSVRTFRLGTGSGELPFTYLPGQYLTLQLMVDGRAVNRSYTIASSPTRKGFIEVTVKREEMGVSSGHLHRTVRQGDRIKVSAPAGKFVFTGEGEASVVLIAGGVGITPLMSITRYLTDAGWEGEIFFVRVARSEGERIFETELGELQRRHPKLRVLTVLTRPGAGWAGPVGRLSAPALTGFVPGLAGRRVYLCGPDGMMSAARTLLRELGVPDTRVHLEAFVSGTSALAEPGMGMAPAGGGPAGGAGSTLSASATVSFARSGKSAELTPELTVLEASEAAGVNLPYECRSGTCGTCKTRLLAGAVQMEVQDALSAGERGAGYILACQARATTDTLSVDA